MRDIQTTPVPHIENCLIVHYDEIDDIIDVSDDLMNDFVIDADDVLLITNTDCTRDKSFFFQINNTECYSFRDSCFHQPPLTVIATCPPRKMIALLEIHDTSSLQLNSDIQWVVPPVDPPPPTIDLEVFPLQGKFMCSQGPRGEFTHFIHPCLHYAVDFRCPVGTPCLAVDDCRITEVNTEYSVGGLDTPKLFEFNSVVVHLQNLNCYAEYVHIASCPHKVGDFIYKNHLLCFSGDVGFCSEPHLHFELKSIPDGSNKSCHMDDLAQTTSIALPFRLKWKGTYQFPELGNYYGE